MLAPPADHCPRRGEHHVAHRLLGGQPFGQRGTGQPDPRSQLEDVDGAERLAQDGRRAAARVDVGRCQLQERGLPGAVGPEHHPSLPLGDLPVDRVQQRRPVPEHADPGEARARRTWRQPIERLIDNGPVEDLLPAGRLAAWGSAALTGAASPDEAADAVAGPVDPGHRVTDLPGEDGPVTLPYALVRIRSLGASGLRLVLPRPGDVSGLPGPAGANAAAARRRCRGPDDRRLPPRPGAERPCVVGRGPGVTRPPGSADRARGGARARQRCPRRGSRARPARRRAVGPGRGRGGAGPGRFRTYVAAALRRAGRARPARPGTAHRAPRGGRPRERRRGSHGRRVDRAVGRCCGSSAMPRGTRSRPRAARPSTADGSGRRRHTGRDRGCLARGRGHARRTAGGADTRPRRGDRPRRAGADPGDRALEPARDAQHRPGRGALADRDPADLRLRDRGQPRAGRPGDRLRRPVLRLRGRAAVPRPAGRDA